jgi:hypothetical protein
MFKVIIAGSREFNDYAFLKQKLIHLLQNINDEIEIVSGRARGADLLGEQFACEMGYKIKYFVPDWDGLGKRAGFVRNRDMAEYADACVVFWKNKSKGTANMIDEAKKRNLKLRIYDVC